MIFLASASLTRFELLQEAGVVTTRVKTEFDEAKHQSAISALPPSEQALFLALGKARLALNVPDGALVIGVDQIASMNGKVFHKAATTEEARQQLLMLRGQTHMLSSAVSCRRSGKEVYSHVSTAELTMRNFSDAFLEAYLRVTGDDCSRTVGCYKIEGPGVQLFSAIAGDYNTILGLPLMPLLEFLRGAGEIQT